MMIWTHAIIKFGNLLYLGAQHWTLPPRPFTFAALVPYLDTQFESVCLSVSPNWMC
jgi:hypothetical protein